MASRELEYSTNHRPYNYSELSEAVKLQTPSINAWK